MLHHSASSQNRGECEYMRCSHVCMTLVTHHIFHVCFDYTFLNFLLSEHSDFSKCIPPIELSYDRPFTLFTFVHHTIILNFITQTWLHLVCFYVPTMSNRSSLHYITRSILFISRVSPNSNSPTSCHCSTYTTCHRPSYIFYFIDILLVTIYSIYTKQHLYCILSTAYSNSI